jgi:hypothetical protein
MVKRPMTRASIHLLKESLEEDGLIAGSQASGSDAVLWTAMASGSDAVLRTAMPGNDT